MKYYIFRPTSEIFAYESDGSQDAYIRDDLELLSDDELAVIRTAQAAAAAPTPEQVLQVANAKRDDLLSVAALRLAPLQDAVDLDTATDADTTNLKLWKQYRVAVNRVPEQPGFPTTINWPAPPV
ncbi:tail fiber assembly protein [Pseudomonas gingeri]|uniref:tail fiber assembly protein n=1 Tax=Pseudomonas gingeri TaxID=117681 RepID=UPI0015A41BA2|nr:tail fiber assembly protein [Pseudomonas gingeri]NWD73268.1 tail fiber assembly protein [Pseudomonas gingeri]